MLDICIYTYTYIFMQLPCYITPNSAPLFFVKFKPGHNGTKNCCYLALCVFAFLRFDYRRLLFAPACKNFSWCPRIWVTSLSWFYALLEVQRFLFKLFFLSSIFFVKEKNIATFMWFYKTLLLTFIMLTSSYAKL